MNNLIFFVLVFTLFYFSSCCNENEVFKINPVLLEWLKPYENKDQLQYKKETFRISQTDTIILDINNLLVDVSSDFDQAYRCHEECSPICEMIRMDMCCNTVIEASYFSEGEGLYFTLEFDSEKFRFEIDANDRVVRFDETIASIASGQAFSFGGSIVDDVIIINAASNSSSAEYEFLYSKSLGLIQASRLASIDMITRYTLL